jgi:hypothetical protein
MGIFRRKVLTHFVPVHPDNIPYKDWIVVLEASTIVGPSPERLRVAKATQERKIVKRRNVFMRSRHFLEIEGFNPRIHTVYFCPQLYKYDSDKKLVPLQGDEIGKFVAQAHEGNVAEKSPWYEPTAKFPTPPIITTSKHSELDSVVVEMPNVRNPATRGS